MRITAIWTLCFILAFKFILQVNPAFGSYKCKKAACDLNAIGHREIVNNGPSVGNWYSPAKEEELGGKYAAALEQKVEVLKDDGINNLVDRVAQHIAQNSDADTPIKVVDRKSVV